MDRVGHDVERAARLLAEGGVVAFPTETVYGLGASIRQPDAVSRVFEVKGRPRDRALIVHVDGPAALDAWATSIPDWARSLATQSWPGPLTLVLPRLTVVPEVVTGGGPTVGLRAPDHPVALELLAALGRLEGGPAGIAAPSANPYQAIPPTTAAATAGMLGDAVDYVLDGGECSVGIESTVLDATGDRPLVLREGAVPRERIAKLLGLEVAVELVAPDASPNSPSVRVVPFDHAEELRLEDGDAVISADDDVAEYGRRLYARLRELGERGHARVFVQRVRDEGIGRAINARIERAAREG